MTRSVCEAVAGALARLGVRQAFGVVGSGNFHFTNALVANGVLFVAARHEGGAATMADAYSRMSGEVALVSVHQGCGLTNAITGIGEAAKSRTALLVVAGEVTDPASNFHMDQAALVQSVGAVSMRVRSAASALEDTRAAYDCALRQQRTVLLNFPVNLQDEILDFAPSGELAPVAAPRHPVAAQDGIEALVELLLAAERPVFIAGRGARGFRARDALIRLGDDVGALLAEGAVAKGLFSGSPWSLGVAGGFSSPLAASLIHEADLIVGWGTTLNMWTTAHGQLVGAEAKVVQVDIEPGALGKNRPVNLGLLGDVALTAAATSDLLRARQVANTGYRSAQIAARLQESVLWRNVAYDDAGDLVQIDPRTLSIALDERTPPERILCVDSGNFMGYPSMYLRVPDEDGFCFTQAFQSIGLGLATGIGASLARPDRFSLVACGDGGFLMGIAELETAVRLKLGMLIVVYNDRGYGAEIYQFKPQGFPTEIVEFPDTDIAAIARGYGADALTVRCTSDLDALFEVVDRGLSRPLVVDAKVVGMKAWWVGKKSALPQAN